MGIPSPTELILILVVVVMVFGPKRIPDVMSQVGKGIKTFKDSIEGIEKEPSSQPSSGVQQAGLSSHEVVKK
jgi:sec-independent protein translocase protein TatA